MIHQVATESECERDLFNDVVIQCIDVPELIPNEMSDGREVERGEENNTRALTVRQSLPEVSLQFSDTISCATPSNPKRAIPAWARLQLREAHFGHVFHDSIYHALRLNQRLQRLLRSTVQIVDVWLVGINASRRDLEADFRDEHRARKQLCITSAEEPFHLNVRDSIEFNLTCEKGRQIEAIYTPPVPRNYFRTTQSCKTGSESTDPTTRLACHVVVPNHDAFLSPWNLFRLLVPYNFRKVNSWSAADDRLLRQGVHYFLQRLRLRSRQRKSLKEFAGMGVMGMTDLLDHSSGVQASWRDAESINWRDLVWKCRNGPYPIAQVIFEYYLKVEVYLPSRQQDDCRLRWANCRDPRLEQVAFTNEEDKILQELVQKGSDSDWLTIANSLSAPERGQEKKDFLLRSATQCAGRYQAYLNSKLIRSTWEETEDSYLRRFVNRNGAGRWSEAVLTLPGHTHAQALHRWQKVLTPGRRKGTWGTNEDIKLRLAVSAYAHVKGLNDAVNEHNTGHHHFVSSETENISDRSTWELQSKRTAIALPWSKISSHVASRTDVQCRERWTNVLNPNLVRPATMTWSQKDDADLLDAVEEFTTASSGNMHLNNSRAAIIAWSHVAERLGRGLTDKMCRNRYKRLLRVHKCVQPS